MAGIKKGGAMARKAFLAVAVAVLFSACNNKLLITADGSGARFLYTCTTDKAPLGRFDAKEVQKALEEAGVTDVKVKRNSKMFSVAGKFSLLGNPFTDSGVVVFGEGGECAVNFTRETLRSLYKAMPEEIAIYVDAYDPPVLGDEEVSDEEYLENIRALYGKAAMKELAAGGLNIEVDNTYAKKENISETVAMLELLNMK